LNLLLINYEYPPVGGGAGNATMFMGKALSDLGHNVTILSTAWQDQRGILKKDRLQLIRLPAWRKDPASASNLEKIHFMWLAHKALKSILAEQSIDAAIIYFSIPCGTLGLSLRKNGIPYIISLRGGDVPGLVPEIVWIHRLITPLRRLILKRALAVIANAEGLAQLSMKADPFAVGIIPNGVDTDFFQPKFEDRNNNSTEFLFVGRFHSQKNLSTLLSAIAKLKHETQKPFHLHLVGNGPLEQQLKSESLTLGLNEEVKWHGWLNKEDLKKLHQQCHVFINPSHYEGLPNAVLEGMASGLTMIVSDIPGNCDLITDKTGYCYPHKDSTRLYHYLVKAHLTPDPNLGLMARQRAIEHYSWKKVALQYLDLFKNPDLTS